MMWVSEFICPPSEKSPTYPWNALEHTKTTPNQEFMIRDSFHLGVKGDSWGMRKRGMLGVLRLYKVRPLFADGEKSGVKYVITPRSGRVYIYIYNPSETM